MTLKLLIIKNNKAENICWLYLYAKPGVAFNSYMAFLYLLVHLTFVIIL